MFKYKESGSANSVWVLIVLVVFGILLLSLWITSYSGWGKLFAITVCLLPLVFIAASVILFLIRFNKFEFKNERPRRIILSVSMGCIFIFAIASRIFLSARHAHPFESALATFFGIIAGPVAVAILSLIFYFLLKIKTMEKILLNFFMIVAVIVLLLSLFVIPRLYVSPAPRRNEPFYNVEKTSSSMAAEAIRRNDPKYCIKGYEENAAGKLRNFIMADRDEYFQEKKECYSLVGIVRGDLSICNDIPTRNERDKYGCYKSAAVKNRDASICDKIVENDGRRNACYNEVGVLARDISICDRIKAVDDSVVRWGDYDRGEDAKIDCYMGIAKAKGDASVCDKIQNYKRAHCYAAITARDRSIGDTVEAQDKKRCYIDVAAAKGNPSLCDKIQR